MAKQQVRTNIGGPQVRMKVRTWEDGLPDFRPPAVLYDPITTHPDWYNITDAADCDILYEDRDGLFTWEPHTGEEAICYTTETATDIVVGTRQLIDHSGVSNGSFFLAVRIVDTDNFIGLRSYQGVTQIYQRVASVFTLLGSFPTTKGKAVSLKAESDGVFIGINGSYQKCNTATTHLVSGRFGIISRNRNEPEAKLHRGFGYEIYDAGGGGGETLGPELITNGDFATDTDWTKGSGWQIDVGIADFRNASEGDLLQSIPTLEGGSTYRLAITTFNGTYGSFGLAIRLGSNNNKESITSDGVHSFDITADSINSNFRLWVSSTSGLTDVQIDNVSLKKIL